LGGLTQKIAETDDFLPFWYRGTRDIFFIGWRTDDAMSFLSAGAQALFCAEVSHG
jgi:hypothetical protein